MMLQQSLLCIRPSNNSDVVCVMIMTAVNVNAVRRAINQSNRCNIIGYRPNDFQLSPVRPCSTRCISQKRLLYNFHHPSSFCGTWRVPINRWRQRRVGKLLSGFITSKVTVKDYRKSHIDTKVVDLRLPISSNFLVILCHFADSAG